MRLLPDEQRTDRRRTVASFRSNHLGPTRTAITLRPGEFDCTRKNRFIPVKTSLKQRQAVPKSKVRRMPPVHFEVKFSVPTVNGESGFLRRHAARTLNCSEILREHNSSLELDRSLVSTMGQLDCRAACPELFPVSLACSDRLSRSWQCFAWTFLRERNDKLRTC